jgi:phosphoglycolate phosphatase-like HAD superfamily hydrolase
LSNSIAILFDLDGTLIDSKRLISHALNKTLSEFGYREFTEEEISNTINTPLKEIFATRANINEVPKLREFYRNYYLKECLPKTKVIPEIPELLKELKEEKAVKIAVITTRNENMAEYILNYFDLNKYIDTIVGHLDGRSIKPNPQPIFIALDRLKIGNLRSIMVGDSPTDIEAGLNAKCYSTIAVLWGFGSRDMLKKAHFIVENVKKLRFTLHVLIEKLKSK